MFKLFQTWKTKLILSWKCAVICKLRTTFSPVRHKTRTIFYSNFKSKVLFIFGSHLKYLWTIFIFNLIKDIRIIYQNFSNNFSLCEKNIRTMLDDLYFYIKKMINDRNIDFLHPFRLCLKFDWFKSNFERRWNNNYW